MRAVFYIGRVPVIIYVVPLHDVLRRCPQLPYFFPRCVYDDTDCDTFVWVVHALFSKLPFVV